jgi:hypothetical protein
VKYPSIIQGFGRLMLNNTLKFTSGSPSPVMSYLATFQTSTGTYSYLPKQTATTTTTADGYVGHDLFVIGNAKNFSTSSSTSGSNSIPKQYVFKSSNIKHTFYLRANASLSSTSTLGSISISPLPLRFTMVYTDYPASIQASNVMVNVLELSVTEQVTSDGSSSSSKTYAPYVGSGSNVNTLNNVQMIDIPAPIPNALYAITITATKIQVSNQSYALVITGAFTMENDGKVSINQQIGTKAPSFAPPITGTDDTVTRTDDDYHQNSTITKTTKTGSSLLPISTIILILIVIGGVVTLAIGGSLLYLCYHHCCSRSDTSSTSANGSGSAPSSATSQGTRGRGNGGTPKRSGGGSGGGGQNPHYIPVSTAAAPPTVVYADTATAVPVSVATTATLYYPQHVEEQYAQHGYYAAVPTSSSTGLELQERPQGQAMAI